jgi:DNA-binding response OmpR family regulator
LSIAGGREAGVSLCVLLVEDEPAVASALLMLLRGSGLRAVHAASGAEARALKHSAAPDIALVDLQLPDISGVSLVRWLVAEGGCGVIVLSGLSDELDRVTCLELGADDYVVKPPNPRELIARIIAVHRRIAAPADAPAQPGARLVLGGVAVDLAARRLSDAQGQVQDLTAAECAVLEALVAAPGQALSRDALSRAVLHRPWRAEDRSVDQLIFQLRRKLGAGEAGRRLIQSVRGEGYRLAPDADAGAPNKT